MKQISIFILIALVSCSKSKTTPHAQGPAGIFSYTITDTAGVSSTFSDTSTLTGLPPSTQTPFYVDGAIASPMHLPAGYVDSATHSFTFQSWHIKFIPNPNPNNGPIGLQNIITFSLPYFKASGPNVALLLNNTNYTASSQFVYFPYNGIVTTTITDSAHESLSGSFSITGQTITGKSISVTGTFTGIPILF